MFLQGACLLRPRLFQSRDLGLELDQGLGHRLQLGLHAQLGDAILRLKRLGGAGDHLIGDDLGRLCRLGFEEFAHRYAAVLDHGDLVLSRQHKAPGGLPAQKSPQKSCSEDRADGKQDERKRVHAPFLGGVAGAA